MNATQTTTLTTTAAADTDRIEMLGQFLAVVDNGEVIAERDVVNGSGRVVGTEYTITTDTLAEIDAAIAAQA